MTDAEYVFNQTSFERKHLGRGAFSKVNGSRSKYCRLPTDGMTQKQIEKEHGQMYTYNLSKPMTYKEFKKLPEDLKVEYIRKLTFEHKGRAIEIAEMFGVDQSCACKVIKRNIGNEYPMKNKKSTSDEWVAFICDEPLSKPKEKKEEVPVEVESVPEAAPCVFKNEAVPVFSIDSGTIHISGNPHAVLAKFLMMLEGDAEYSFDIKFRKGKDEF